MLIAFLLVVLVEGEVGSDNRMLFRDVLRCNFFAHAIESGRWSEWQRPHLRQQNVTAYCVPTMVSENAKWYE